jgi:hypothetical protein
MEQLKELNGLLRASLEALRTETTEKLILILNGTAIEMLPGYEKEDLAAFNFEYRNEWLSVLFFGSNARGVTVTETLSLLFKDLDEYRSGSEEVMNEIDEAYEDREDDSDEREEMMEEYNEERTGIFEDWFTACWQEARNITGNTTPTYYSDEVDLGIELNESVIVEINKNQSNIRYYS